MTLEGSRAKLRRAHEHFAALDADIGTFLEAHPYRVLVESPARNLYVVRLNETPRIPGEHWAVLIGDCVHNLRCALDYIAWLLAGGDPTDSETQFPIFTTEAGWKARGQRCVRRMSSAAQAFIERGQPYNGPDPPTAALNGLRLLSDADKHKLLTVVAAVPADIGLTWHIENPSAPMVALNPNANLMNNAVLATLKFPDGAENVQVECEFTPDVSFGDLGGLGRRVHVIGSLSVMLIEIDAVITAFEQRPELFPS
jgi:hypothetical protein